MSNRIRRICGCVALALACVMVGSAMTLTLDLSANAESNVQTVIHTSPFTAAIAEVRDSVVGVSNYQEVTYGNYYNGFGNFPFGFGYGYGYGNGRDQEPETREELASSGSGVVIGDGFVLTNYHVVEDASALRVTVTDDAGKVTEYAANLVAYDEALDAAIIYAPDCKLPAVKLGDSDTMLVGDWAICIGNPLGFAKTTTGIVSALNRAVKNESYDKYGRLATTSNAMIQVDAAINSGNSGGGMFSVTGELMGIPTLKYTGSYYSGAAVEGIGMCVPINAVKPLIDDVLSGKIAAIAPEKLEEKDDSDDNISLVGRPRLGVSIDDVNANSRAARTGQIPDGVFLTNVEEGSPAEKAGLLVGDIIVDVDGTVITSATQLQQVIRGYNAGDVLAIKVYRAPGILDISGNENAPEGEYVDVTLTLAVIDGVKQ